MELPGEYQQCNWWDGCGGGTYVGGGGGSEPSPPADGPFLAAVVCLVGVVATGLTMEDAVQGFAAIVNAKEELLLAQRTFDMYAQQPVSAQDPAMYYTLERDLNAKKQAYKSAVDGIALKMNVSYAAAVGTILTCGMAFALPTP